MHTGDGARHTYDRVYLVHHVGFVPGTSCGICTRYIMWDLYLVRHVGFVPGTSCGICTRYIMWDLYLINY
jgi:hypothetical protein